jgi:anti-sigma regulatory factor (Ser/Thr protein kinase)
VAHAASPERTTVKHSLRSGPEAPGRARRLVELLKLGSATHAIVELLVSELVTNAVIHSGSRRRGRLCVSLQREGEFIAVEVWDRGGAAFKWQRGATELTEPGGQGLVLVDRLAHRWGIRSERGNAVWFVYRDPTFA